MHIKTSTLIVAAALAVTLSAGARAATMPHDGALVFDVIRKGKDIGDQSYAFSTAGGRTTVQVRAKVAVKVPLIGITAYSFDQNSTEIWQAGKAVAIASNTNDNGDPHHISLSSVPAFPASLWSVDTAAQTTLLNTIDGHLMKVRVADLGTEPVKVGGHPVNAHHFRISGDLARDVWYDDTGVLAHLVMKGDDGSTVTYVRR